MRAQGPGSGRRLRRRGGRRRHVLLGIVIPACSAVVRDVLNPNGYVRSIVRNWREAGRISADSRMAHNRVEQTTYEEIDNDTAATARQTHTPVSTADSGRRTV
jgi:hypothetical protein